MNDSTALESPLPSWNLEIAANNLRVGDRILYCYSISAGVGWTKCTTENSRPVKSIRGLYAALENPATEWYLGDDWRFRILRPVKEAESNYHVLELPVDQVNVGDVVMAYMLPSTSYWTDIPASNVVAITGSGTRVTQNGYNLMPEHIHQLRVRRSAVPNPPEVVKAKLEQLIQRDLATAHNKAMNTDGKLRSKFTIEESTAWATALQIKQNEAKLKDKQQVLCDIQYID